MVTRLIGLVAAGVLAVVAGCAPTPPVTPTSTTSAAPLPSPTAEPPQVAVGDCTGAINLSGASMADVQVIACDQPHYFEAFATVPIPGTDHPGAEALTALAETECAVAFEDFVGVAPAYSRYASAFLAPDEAAWPLLDQRQLTCLVGSPDGDLVGSAEGDSRIFPEKGQCTGPQDIPAVDIEILDCAEDHNYEVYAQKTITSKTAPKGKALDKLIDSVCVAGFKKFVGIEAAKSKYDYLYFLAPAELWKKVADHRIVCSVG